MSHLKITFTVVSPILAPTLSTHIHLDGLLSHAQVGLMSGGMAHGEDLQEMLDSLPLDRFEAASSNGNDPQWVYKASRLFFEHETNPALFGPAVIAMTKKTDAEMIANFRVGEDFDTPELISKARKAYATAKEAFKNGLGPKPGKLELPVLRHRIDPLIETGKNNFATGSDFMRNWFFKYRAWMPQKVHAFAVGDAENVLELAQQIQFIGKKPANGYGAVNTDATTVEVIEEAECLWYVRNMPEPIKGLEASFMRSIGTLRAPYWDRTKNQNIYVHEDAV